MRAAEMCAIAFATRHPAEAAQLLERLPSEVARVFLEGAPPPVGAQLLREMSPGPAAGVLALLDAPSVAAPLNLLPGHLAASLLRRLPQDTAARVLAELDSDARKVVDRSLRYAEGSAGALADATAPALAAHMTVADARRRLRGVLAGAHPYVYVTDDAHRLVGVVHTRTLAAARAPVPLSALMRGDLTTLPAVAHVTAVAAHPAWRELDPLPVVDGGGVLVGALRHQRVRQAASRDVGGSVTDALLQLGELYWLGVSMMLPGLVAGTAATEVRANPEGTDGS